MQSHVDNRSVDGGFDESDYSYANPQNASHNPLVHGERDLWCAVIAQAFVDMGAIRPVTSRRRPGSPKAGDEGFNAATRWLLRNKADFAYVCDLAGVSPQIIRRAAQVFYGRVQSTFGAVHITEK
jgi:hypothetical protein